MEGKTHKQFAPIFTLGSSLLVTKIGLVDTGFPMLVTVAVATASSMMTSVAPDGDLVASRPYYVVWNKPHPSRVKKGSYRVNTAKGPKVYHSPKSLQFKIWGTLFRILGATKHRGWKSHALSMWVALWAIAYQVTLTMTSDYGALGSLLSSVVLGMGFGYISHLVGDLFTKQGIPLLPFTGDTSPVKMIVPKFAQGLFASGSKFFNFLIIFAGVNFVLAVIAPDVMLNLYKIVGSISIIIMKLLMNVLGKGIVMIFEGIRGR